MQQVQDFKDQVFSARDSIFSQFDGQIDQAIILGSGLSSLDLAGFDTLTTINYADIQGLPPSTAPSHVGQLRLISNGRKTIALCKGRQHLYEGYSAQQVCTMVYALSTLGAHTLVVTNASGALNAEYRPGDVMLISDHINMTGQNPVIGQDERFGITFPDMSQAYCKQLSGLAYRTAKDMNIKLHSGVYMGVTGPSLETSAERRMFRTMGADAIGMSTVLEVIGANHCGMNVLGLSAITNLALGDEHQKPDTIEEVLAHASIAGAKIKSILEKVLGD
ncbi:MAG: purine-nucleoside phosphorylase [Acidiferrobacterales bacterium]|nr:purine-nucleoside phosphorylase [Acidiferrobacterales bacterium]